MRIGEASNRDDLLVALDEELRTRLELRRGIETIWWNNLAMLAGDHYAQWDPTRQQYVEEQQPRHRVRLVLNHCLTVVRTEYSKLLKSRPIMDVVAGSDNATDIAAAKVSKKALDAAEWHFKLQKLRKRALSWGLSCGQAFILVDWDPEYTGSGYKEYYLHPETQQPVFDPEQQAELDHRYEIGELNANPKQQEPLGDLCYRIYSAFQILPDPYSLEWEQCNDLITIDVYGLDEAEAKWPGISKLGPDNDTTLGTVERRAISRINLDRWKNMPVRDAIQVYTYWLKPGIFTQNRFLKDGLTIRWCKRGEFLDMDRPYPFDDGELPFAIFEHIPSDASIWAQSIVQHIRGANLEMDKTASQLIENKDFMANPMWKKAIQHRIRGPVKNIPGGMVEYQHVPGVPEPMPVVGMALPSQVENILIYLRDQILDISGQGETSRGRLPSGVRSGVQIAYLQEEDDTRLAPTLENYEEFIERMAMLTLSRMQQFYTTERVLENYKPDGQFDVAKFKGADLSGNTKIVVQAGSAFPQNKAMKQQHILDLVQLGVEVDPKRVRDLLEIGGAQPDDVDLNLAQANRENMYMVNNPDMMIRDPMTGGTVRWYQLHDIHLKQHYGFMATPEYEDLIRQNQAVDQYFTEHTNEHEQMKMMQMQQQMMMLAAQKGAPGPGNGPNPNPTNNNAPGAAAAEG